MSAMPSKLGDFITHVRSVAPQAVFGESNFTYVDISSVDRASKSILNPQVISTSAAPSRARQELALDDVIVSTVRPNLNTVAIVTDEHVDAIASTGFCVLRADTERLDPRYLYRWVSSEATVARLVSLATGATYPAVSDKIIKSLEVSFPSLSEQKRIAEVIDKADSLSRKRREAIRLADVFLRSVYLDLAANNPGRASVESVLADIPNAARTGPFGSQMLVSEFTETGIPVLGIDNVVSNTFTWGSRRFISPEKYKQLERFTVRPGDVMITIMGTTGRVAVAPEDLPVCISTKHLCTMSLDLQKMCPSYLWACLRWDQDVRAQTKRESKGAIMDGWNMGIVKGLLVSKPPVQVQFKFEAILSRMNKFVLKASQATGETDALIAALFAEHINAPSAG